MSEARSHRHGAYVTRSRDGLTVMAFSLASSASLALLLISLVHRRSLTMSTPATSRCSSTGSSPWWRPRSTHPGSVLVDATLGLGGHAEAVLERCPSARVIGVDRDQHALELAGARLGAVRRADHPGARRVRRDPRGARGPAARRRSTAMLFDLGVSSMQLDVRERGFAYAEDAPLDMRMDDSDRARPRPTCSTPTRPPTWPGSCAPTARRSSPARSRGPIVRARETAPFTGSARLVDLLRDTIPAPARRTGGHPAKRTFQALRIEVNDELGVLRRAIPAAIDVDRRRRPGRGDELPLARGPAGQAGLRRTAPPRPCRPTCPVVPAGYEPPCAWSPAGPRRPPPTEIAPEPARRLRAAARRRTRQHQHHRGDTPHEHL